MKYEVIKSGHTFMDANCEYQQLWLARPTTCEAPSLYNRYFTEQADALEYAAKMNKKAGL